MNVRLDHTIHDIANSKQKKQVAFDNLPELVKEWDKSATDQINSFQKTVIASSGLNS